MKRVETEYRIVDPEVADWRQDRWDRPEVVGVVEPLRRETRLVKWVTYTALCLVLAGILVAGAAGWWYVNRINPEGEAGEPMTFIVRKGDSIESVSERLEDNGWITDAGVFRWYVRNHGGLTLTPGYYEIPKGDHMGNVLGRLRTPPSQTYTQVTFPEGFTVGEIAQRLAADGPRMSVGNFQRAAANPEIVANLRPPGVTSLEGLLFPDTYQISNSESEAQAIERMIALMERVANQEDIGDKAAALGMTPYQTLIVASLVEEEAKFDEDRPKIARVIYNRLARGMPLQVDATLLYQQDRDRPIPELRQVDTPYNTYLHTGLPPTPISNPGRASIRAALNPSTDPATGDPICLDLRADAAAAGVPPPPCVYLYYVLSDNEGHHVFAATGEQHQENVQRAIDAGVEL